MIALYGATGYTGRLVTDELVRRGADFVLGGRNRQKLERLASERGRGAALRVASIDDPRSLRDLLDGCDVLINCAGPFTEAGEPVVRAAIDSGVHYVDSTGEHTFMRLVFDRYGAEAEKRGVGLLPAMGFDYAPGDCIARLAAEGHEPCEEVLVAYSVRGFGMSRGTMRSALHIVAAGDRSVTRSHFDFPEPIGRQTMLRFPSGEPLTVPLHTQTRRVTSLMSARMAAPIPQLAPAVPYLQPGLAAVLRTPVRRALGHLIDRLPEGPSEDARRRSEFTIVAVARGAGGSEGRAIVRGRDVYGSTAVSLVYAAQRMETGFDKAGPLAPATAVDPVELLNHLGFAFERDRERVAASA